MHITLMIMGTILLSSCASMEKSVGLGMGVGAAAGAATGYAINFNLKGMALTTATGALTGGLIGYVIHKMTEKDVAPNDSKNVPLLRDAQTESLWIAPHIEGSRYIEWHSVHVIKDPATWQLSDGEGKNEQRKEKTK